MGSERGKSLQGRGDEECCADTLFPDIDTPPFMDNIVIGSKSLKREVGLFLLSSSPLEASFVGLLPLTYRARGSGETFPSGIEEGGQERKGRAQSTKKKGKERKGKKGGMKESKNI